jgi:hypothetical protein
MNNSNYSGIPPVPKGHQQLTVNGAAQAPTIPLGTTYAMIRAEVDVRWRDDGTAPTAAIGYPLYAGEELRYDAVTGLANLKFFNISTGGTVNIAYYGT